MNICLINPPHSIPKELGIPPIFQPLGLLYVAAALEKDNNNVTVIDANAEILRVIIQNGSLYSGLSISEILHRVEDISPDIIGISLLFSINEWLVIKLASKLKEQHPDCRIIVGGTAATVRAKNLIQNAAIDYIVLGEGETTTLELIRCIKYKDDPRTIKGICCKQSDNKIVLTNHRDHIQDLDQIAYPARHLVNMTNYFGSYFLKRNVRTSYTYDSHWATLITSRGCPYKCSFCSIHLSMGRQYRTRSPESVVSEIESLIKEYKIKHINFEDDNISLNPIRFETLLDIIIEKQLGITWSTPNGIRADTLTPEIITKMALSGCKRVFVAPESGAQRVVNDIIGKKQDLNKVRDVVKCLIKNNITVDASFVIGHIGETKDEIIKTIRYAKELKKIGVSDMAFHIATPYYGTDLWNCALRKHYFIDGFKPDMLYTTKPLLETPDWSVGELKTLQNIASWIVFCNPILKIPSILKSILSFKFQDAWNKVKYYWI